MMHHTIDISGPFTFTLVTLVGLFGLSFIAFCKNGAKETNGVKFKANSTWLICINP